MRGSLTDNNRFFKALIQFRTDTVSVIDADGFYLYYCDSMKPTLGWKADELLTTNLLDYIHKEDTDLVITALSNALSDAVSDLPAFRFRSKNGQWRWMESDIANLLEDEHVGGLVIRSRDVTEKMEAEEREEENYAYYQSLFYNHPDAVYSINTEGTIEDANESAIRIFGYSKEEIIGKPLLAFAEAASSTLAPETIENIIKGEPCTFETQALHKNGQVRNISVTSVPAEVESKVIRVYCVVRDITHQRQVNSQLQEQSAVNKKLSLIASVVTNGVLVLDKDGQITWINAGFTKLTGYTAEEVLGKQVSELLLSATSNTQNFDRLAVNFVKGNAFSEDMLHYQKDGNKVWFRIDATPVLETSGNVQEYFIILTDITQEKESEENLYKQNRDLQQFTYIVSHNLRAPLANILGLTTLLTKTNKDSPAFEQTVPKLHASATQLDKVIKDMHSILAVRNKAETDEMEPVKLAQVLNQVQETLQDFLEKAGGTCTTDVRKECILYANSAYMYSIFYNLLSNAIKYRSKKRKLEINVSCQSNRKNELEVQVRDNGTGMDMQRVGKRIFQLYKRFNTTAEGRGIGLYLVKTQVEALGGRIEVASEPDKGTTFTIRFRNR